MNPKRVFQPDGQPMDINFGVSRRVSQRMATIVMKIFLTEVLGYPGVSIFEVEEEDFGRNFDEMTFDLKK